MIIPGSICWRLGLVIGKVPSQEHSLQTADLYAQVFQVSKLFGSQLVLYSEEPEVESAATWYS